MCPATCVDALGGTPAANDADGRHIRKVAGWIHVFDALSLALVEHWRCPDRMHGPDGSDGQTQEQPNENALGVVQEEPNASVNSNQQHQSGGDAFGHGVVRLGSDGLKLGPDRLERVGEHFLPGNLPLRFALDGNCQLCVDGLAVGRVLKVMAGRAALLGEDLTVLDFEGKDVGLEVHGTQE